ncbi:DUF6517 family protein [Natrinema sp. 1APR25-10V2]|uniref:DUF6517 family protein n=1 Tax=Natrinema sp. 1APR25-10V2 TaxID=2951081 RepID=UPI002874F900|nr:DUF6517 family protein [Natrinema sp. 1APR25-10V2]MDS0477796.1 DUF6517 family protein [Natrinema sp. 1APR25-10V2]
MNRRRVLAGIGTAGLAGLSGCLGVIGMANHESAPAGVEASARDDTGYEQTTVDEIGVEKEVPGGGLTGTVSVTNHMTKHEKSVDMGPLGSRRGAVFNVLTTPKVKLLGKQFNPVEEMSTKELVDLVENNYNGIENISHVEDAEVTILEETTTQSQFTADAKFDGQSVTVDLHVTKAVEADDDLLVTIGVYPEQLRMQEKSNITSLAEAVTTEVDESASSGDSSDDGGNESSGDSNSTDEKSKDGNQSDGDDDGGVLG